MRAEPEITPAVYTGMGLNEAEYARIAELLGRTPSYTELGMFAVMWSEHCGYKFSRPVLARFGEYKKSLEGDGLENAGVVDIGGGWGVTMKVESHNHPSAVEPYQGAATGVGGIIRDILTMGARPVALLNSLRFGPLSEARSRYLFEHVVAGIAGYGNCVGVPTVGGEIAFHPRYAGNPLVNAMCVGVLRLDEVTTASASGVGNPVLYLGSATGRDGIHGATFASEALDEDSDVRRPNVQIGDPFAEKGLIEATLEALATGAIVAIQDMGAAGLTCSTVEMASKGRVGMTVDLDRVPMREGDMSGYELMLSESQERMLAVAHRGREGEVLAVFEKWGLPAVVVGEVTEGSELVVSRSGEVVARLDPRVLTDECPVYASEAIPGEAFERAARFDPALLPRLNVQDTLLRLLAHPDVASKRPVFEQYDGHVLTQTLVGAGEGDAAVLHPDGTEVALALSLDGNARWTSAHPRRGGRLAVAEASRNVACVGARAVACTDGLNFGNPTHPHVFFGFREAVYGIAEAAEALGTPVISGNVSFYNESDLGEVPPTPLVGMLGVVDRWRDARVVRPEPVAPEPSRAAIVLLDAGHGEAEHGGIGASLLLEAVHGIEDGYPVDADLAGEARLGAFLVAEAREESFLGAHDLSDGGLGVALAELAMLGGTGLDAMLPEGEPVATLFAEYPGLVLAVTRRPAALTDRAEAAGLSTLILGSFRDSGELSVHVGEREYRWTLAELRDRYENAFVGTFSDPALV